MMKPFHLCLFALLFQFCIIETEFAYGGDWRFGIGLTSGVSRLEADLKKPKLSPLISGHLQISPLPYLAFSGEFGFALLSGSDPSAQFTFTDFKTQIIPMELSAIFNFLPSKKLNPFILVGGGGVYWNATNNGTTISDNSGKKQNGIDSFLKAGGGLEYRVSPKFGFQIGATFRYSLTEAFDQLWSGDEKDQVVDVHAGFTYYFTRYRNDRDHDLIPDDLDLMPEIAEDKDGYLDHDGIPEKNPNPVALHFDNADISVNSQTSSPFVIHHLVGQAESGSNIPIKAFVYSDIDLRVVAILYRPIGAPNWNVVRMEDRGGNLYDGEIPGYAVSTQGIEYSVVAVDETLSGIGYSGLPSKPIRVNVSPSGKPWRIIGGVIGTAAIGTASYLILRKQKN